MPVLFCLIRSRILHHEVSHKLPIILIPRETAPKQKCSEVNRNLFSSALTYCVPCGMRTAVNSLMVDAWQPALVGVHHAF